MQSEARDGRREIEDSNKTGCAHNLRALEADTGPEMKYTGERSWDRSMGHGTALTKSCVFSCPQTLEIALPSSEPWFPTSG